MAVVIGLGPWIISSSLTSSMSLRSIAASPAPATNSLSNEGNVHQFEATSRFNPSMAIVVVVLLSTFFFMGFVSVYLRKCVVSERERDIPYQRAPGAAQRRTIQGLDKATIGSFPVVRFSLVKGLNKGKSAIECTVCLTEFQEQENIRVLPKCGHSFHLDCIDMWLFSHTTCPLCRQSLALNPEDISLADSYSTEEGFALERRLGESGRNITQSIADQGHEVRLTLIDSPRQNEVAVDRRDEARERESTVALSKNSESVKITAQDLEKLEKLSASSATYNAKSRKTEDGSSSMSASLITSTSSTLMHRSQSCSVLAEMLKRSHGTDEDKSSSL